MPLMSKRKSRRFPKVKHRWGNTLEDRVIIQRHNTIKDGTATEAEAVKILEDFTDMEDIDALDLRIHILHEQLITSPSPIIRAAATSCLSRLHSEDTQRHLRQAWIREEHPRLKIFIKKVLTELVKG